MNEGDSEMEIKVLIVDDHPVVLKGLSFFLQTQPNIKLVGQAMNGEEAVAQVEKLRPDVVLMDLKMPVMDGIEATRNITSRYQNVKVIVLTSFADRDSVLPAIKAGAIGYQLKDVEPEMLLETIETVMQGNRSLHPQVTNQLIADLTNVEQQATGIEQLTSREQDVLRQITLGLSNKEIAAALHITEKTVKTHITHILAKLDVQDRTQAALYAMRKRWFES